MSLNKHLIQIKDFPEYSVDEQGAKTSGEKSSRSVRVIETGVIYPSIRECARQIGGHANAILACCNGRYKQHYGYSFEWV